MTERLYLHVGSPKSGTTYLQSILRANRQRLAEAGTTVVGRRPGDLVRAGLIVREDPRVEGMTPDEAASWDRLVTQVRDWQGPTAVLSYELLAGASAEQAQAAIAAFEGIEVHVVVTARDLGRMVASAWQERLKFRIDEPMRDYRLPSEADGPVAEWGWRTMDPAAVTGRWGAGLPPERVHLVTVPRAGSDRDALWRRFAAAIGLDVEVDLATTVANESLAPATAEVLRHVNLLGDERIVSNREHKRWLRNVLAHRVLAPLAKETIGITDEQYADAVEVSDRAIAEIAGRGYDVHGDLDDLRATRPEGRLPEDVPTEELLDTSVRALFELLVVLRDEAPRAHGSAATMRTSSAPVPAPATAPAAPPAATTTPPPAAPTPAAPAGGAPERSRAATSARRVARAALDRAGAPVARHRVAELQRRVADLEDQLKASRVLQRRVAELDDLVSELLLPATEQDGQVLLDAVTRYRDESV